MSRHGFNPWHHISFPKHHWEFSMNTELGHYWSAFQSKEMKPTCIQHHPTSSALRPQGHKRAAGYMQTLHLKYVFPSAHSHKCAEHLIAVCEPQQHISEHQSVPPPVNMYASPATKKYAVTASKCYSQMCAQHHQMVCIHQSQMCEYHKQMCEHHSQMCKHHS